MGDRKAEEQSESSGYAEGHRVSIAFGLTHGTGERRKVCRSAGRILVGKQTEGVDSVAYLQSRLEIRSANNPRTSVVVAKLFILRRIVDSCSTVRDYFAALQIVWNDRNETIRIAREYAPSALVNIQRKQFRAKVCVYQMCASTAFATDIGVWW